MEADSTLPQAKLARKSPVPKSGVLTLSGFGITARVHRGHLELQDGVGLERRKMRLPRVGHGLKRLVVIGADGMISLAALEWLAAQDASFVMVERNGKVQCVTGPSAPSDARLRRSQSLALGNGAGTEICRKLIDAKLQGQERVIRELSNSGAAREIANSRDRLAKAESAEAIRWLESYAANAYFGALREIPVQWPKADLSRLPAHWKSIGSRHSPLSGGPRLAVTPFHAVLNYCFALVEAQSRLSLVSVGLDPALGLGLHTDTPNRDSLALDVLEPVRPEVERWLLSWVLREPFRKADFFETATGNCRLKSHFCARLSQTAPTWGKLVAPWAEFIAQALWTGANHRRAQNLILPTRLTQLRRTEARGKMWTPSIKLPKKDHLCRGCGKEILNGRTHCGECAVSDSTERLIKAAAIGRQTANGPKAQAKRVITNRKNALAQHAWKPSEQPPWLTQRLYADKMQPLLAEKSSSEIARQIAVSRWYAGRIREGYRPHPRHWQALAKLVGVSG